MSLNSSQNKTFSGKKKSRRENQKTHFMFNNFFSENRAFYEIMPKNMAKPEPQMTSQLDAYALHAG
jgi:hypothetical protein